ncbi:MAG TPA: serine hydrolase domain-containing protein [Solirubrobacteraceae bacterium]|nr:serine hydrolase domain-containing protein [Solirubrobacteraceae bacterium]
MPTRLTSAAIERIHGAAEAQIGDSRIPGLVALVASGDDAHVEALGRLAVGGAPVARDSLFRIASTTKPITAAATLAVIAEGALGIDDPVDRLLPELAERRVLRRMDGPLDETVPAARAITTRDLLTFTFGFGLVPEIFTAPTTWPVVTAEQALNLSSIGGPPDPSIQPAPDTWIANLGTLPLMAQPGERWLYNTGASVLGVLLARATGEPFADVLRTRVFEPLGMSDTAFWTADTQRLATAYRPSRDGLVVWDEPDGTWSRPPAFGDGAADLLSTADDLLTFARMLLGGGAPVLSGEAVREMTSPQLTEAQESHGGLLPGFFDHQSWGFLLAVHDSGAYTWDGGFGVSWLVDPANDLVVIVMTQRMFESPALPQPHREIRAAAYSALAQ